MEYESEIKSIETAKKFSIPKLSWQPNRTIVKLTFMQRKTWSCLWNSARTAKRSDLSKRETWERMKRSSRTELERSLLSSLATMRPSLPISFFLLHIDKLGLEANPETCRNNHCCCVFFEIEKVFSKSKKGFCFGKLGEDEDEEEEGFLRRSRAWRSI